VTDSFAERSTIIVEGNNPFQDVVFDTNKGTETIMATTFVTFNHQLYTTPTLVLASFSVASYGNYTWTATSTQITITVSTSGTYTVYWYAEV